MYAEYTGFKQLLQDVEAAEPIAFPWSKKIYDITTDENGKKHLKQTGEEISITTDAEGIKHLSLNGQEIMTGKEYLISVNIPEGVTEIKDRAFQGSSLRSVNIPGVKILGDATFYDCGCLESAKISKGVEELRGTFDSCYSLKTVNIPEGVTTIGEWAFYRCEELTSINLPDSVKEIDFEAFYGCSSLTSINIPEGVTTIRGGAFKHCSSLTSINLPSSVSYIPWDAFEYCDKLTITCSDEKQAKMVRKSGFRGPVNIAPRACAQQSSDACRQQPNKK